MTKYFQRSFLVLGLAVGLSAGCKEEKGLRITGAVPNKGPTNGGSVITISGSGFQQGGAKGVKVYFGDKEARFLAFDGDDKMKVEPPPGEPNQVVDIQVIFDDAKELTCPKCFSYFDYLGNEGGAPAAAGTPPSTAPAPAPAPTSDPAAAPADPAAAPADPGAKPQQ